MLYPRMANGFCCFRATIITAIRLIGSPPKAFRCFFTDWMEPASYIRSFWGKLLHSVAAYDKIFSRFLSMGFLQLCRLLSLVGKKFYFEELKFFLLFLPSCLRFLFLFDSFFFFLSFFLHRAFSTFEWLPAIVFFITLYN